MTSSDEDVLRFIAASFPSVWALELLLTLKHDPRVWTQDELVERLRASELVVSNSLDALVAGGLASRERGGVAFRPVNREAAEAIERAEQMYRTRPNAVRRAIISARTDSATAFSDAFKLRRDRDD